MRDGALAGSQAGLCSGAFWHDRAPRPTHYLPRSGVTRAQRSALWALCAEATGVPATP